MRLVHSRLSSVASLRPKRAAQGQATNQVPPPSVVPPSTDAFVETWEQIQADRLRAIERAGQTPTANAIRSIVRNQLRRRPVPSYPAKNKERVPDLEMEETVQVLVTAGVPVSALTGQTDESRRYLDAGRRVADTQGSFRDQLLLAPVVAIVSPTEVVRDESPNDGLNATVSFRVDKLLKGPSDSTTFRVRQWLLPSPGGQAQITIDTGQRFLVFLSDARYKFVAARKGKVAAEGFLIEVFKPYKIVSDELVATDHYQPRANTSASALSL